ncbi:MAG: isoprenylcysteine carboxylmethyltransferase family protein [Prolixibacteraceae bacterium]|nr:isoprenylcysteine carboxylmethyltransferase family protein [Prolixibacteraceae bacterium]MBN2774120.1 isoprenylcysteine carboxylmethyltransferase family protein [Prolixibacteraceae bacterium]
MDFFNYFQFISLILFLGIFIGRSVWLHKTGIRIFVIGKGKDGIKALMEIVFVGVLFIWIYEILRISAGISFSILPTFITIPFIGYSFIKLVGVILITLGLIIFVLALIAFNTSWRIGIDTENPGDLVTSGIFSVTRNPVFVFINLYFIGTALIYTNWFFTGLAIMAVFGIHFHILNEEKFLLKQYGNKYSEYRKKVRRYL